MGGMKNFVTLSIFLMFSFFGCATSQPQIPFDRASSQPGTQVSYRGNPVKLLGSPVSVGKPLPSVEVVDAMSMKDVDLSKERGSIFLLSIVPLSIHPSAKNRPITWEKKLIGCRGA
jgi:thiol peroxidase